MMRQFELVELVKSYDPHADEALLNRAYVYTMKAHGAQLRASGDPYFSHPIEVAGLLAQMKLDGASIVTGLLHDTVEDTVATLEDIERLFGPDIAKIMPVYVAAIPGLLLVLVQLYRDATQWDRRRAKEAEASRWMRSMMSSWIRRSSSGAR